MRSFLSFLLINLTAINAYCQDRESIAFLHGFLGQSAKIVYMDKLWESGVDHMQQALAPDTLRDVFGAYGFNPNDRLVLTQQERNYILNESKRQSEVTWTNQLFANGKLMTKAALDSMYKDPARGWAELNEQYGSSIYSFSKPIFIRNHSLCLFYYSYSCGSRCGEGKLRIFKKKDATWVPWIVAYRWVS